MLRLSGTGYLKTFAILYLPIYHTTNQNLVLNTDKSDVILIGTSAQSRAADHISEIVVAGANLKPVAVINSLGVILDSRLSCAAHVTAVCKACN